MRIIKKDENSNGITLISLVITIVLILILMGVTIGVLIGEGGLIKSTLESKMQYEIEYYKEQVEIARGDAMIEKQRKATLDELLEKIEEKKVFEGGHVRKVDDTKAKATTKEGYMIEITEDGVIGVGKEEVNKAPTGELIKGKIKITIKPGAEKEWTNENVEVTITNNVAGNYYILYSFDNPVEGNQKWNETEAHGEGASATITVETNRTIYANIRNAVGERTNTYASMEIKKIDKITPPKFNAEITKTTKSITIDASSAKDGEKTKEYGQSGIASYSYSISKDGGITWQGENEEAEWTEYKNENKYTFDNLTQSKEYQVRVKVKDKAGNETKEEDIVTQKKETETVSVASGNIKYSAPNWNADTHKASITLSTTVEGMQIQYQVGSITGEWQTGTTVSNLEHNNMVYMRLWDGINGGSEASYKIQDSEQPTIIATTSAKTNSITVNVGSLDEQWGMPDKPTYTVTLTADGQASQSKTVNNGETSCTFSGLKQTVTYTITVKAKDKANNEGSVTKTQKTGTVSVASGNIKYSAPNWNADTHKASITLSTTVAGMQTQYQVGSTKGTWQTGTTVSNLEHNNIVYMRLWDGTNGGSETSYTIKDGAAPSTPTINTNGYTSGTWTNQKITITLSASDGQSGIMKWQLSTNNGGSWSDCGNPFVAADDGQCTVKFRAVDKAGNASGASTAVTLKEDKTPPSKPTINLNGYTSGSWTNKDVKQTASSTDATSGIAYYMYSHNKDRNGGNFNNPWTINWDGQWNFYVWAVDNAGNMSDWSNVYTIKRDTTPPSVSLTGTANGSTDVTLRGTGTDTTNNVFYQWSTSSSAPSSNWISSNSKTTNTQTKNVTQTYYFWVKDEAGNTAKKQATVSKHKHSGNSTNGGGCYGKRCERKVTKRCEAMVSLRNTWEMNEDTGTSMKGIARGTCSNGHGNWEYVYWGYGTSWNGQIDRQCSYTYEGTEVYYELNCGLQEVYSFKIQ